MKKGSLESTNQPGTAGIQSINASIKYIYRVSQKKVDPLRVSSIFSLGLSLFA